MGRGHEGLENAFGSDSLVVRGVPRLEEAWGQVFVEPLGTSPLVTEARPPVPGTHIEVLSRLLRQEFSFPRCFVVPFLRGFFDFDEACINGYVGKRKVSRVLQRRFQLFLPYLRG